jgi:hypothetical protein
MGEQEYDRLQGISMAHSNGPNMWALLARYTFRGFFLAIVFDATNSTHEQLRRTIPASMNEVEMVGGVGSQYHSHHWKFARSAPHTRKPYPKYS